MIYDDDSMKEIEDKLLNPTGDLVDFLAYLDKVWYWGIKQHQEDDGTLVVEMATIGMSCNEDIIEILQKTMFWIIGWHTSMRGGYYEFTLKPAMFSWTQWGKL